MEMLRGSLEGSGVPSTHSEMHSSPTRESKCPFTGMVEEAFTQNGRSISWTEAARSRAERIPSFARSMAMKSVEDYATQKGYPEITEAVLEEMRGGFGF
jgi:hypothetical protein